jgi:hypothetical protein
MTEMSRDSRRAVEAAKVLLDGRDPVTDFASVLITLDHLVATVLLVTMGNDHRKAVGMLNEGLVPNVEERIALYAAGGNR